MARAATLHACMCESTLILAVTTGGRLKEVAHAVVELLLGQFLDDSPLLRIDGLVVLAAPVVRVDGGSSPPGRLYTVKL